ncbi:aldehyde dehydrogenase family 3 member H1 isoform X1 [Cajanus cajan]|uniref:Aldehyde dehydrogenase n=1 Tax=Cajanus cajan TaxID=3821 RepID=A0A151RT03_CAJCA|nr:aldehyde dehydrogenase family 3 member H1 isoform X1 [Cajanus cajan]KYP45669.1 Aldehyde dehydrogenase family 3 member H1 [Cajanus cajan]
MSTSTDKTTSEEEKRAFVDAEAASLLVKELRGTFASGKTRGYQWRVSQLKALAKLIVEREQEIVDALRNDIAKPPLETVAYEIAMLKNSCKVALKELKHWMTPEKVKTSITTFPSSAEIVPEPLGVVLIISAWNYPFLLSLDPVIGAIAAGNTVVLKPSEIAPATSSLMVKLLGDYMDNSCIRVVEGAVDETSALLQQKWDKIFYTGNGRVARIVMAAAAKHLTPVVLELGGKSPVVVDSNINLKVATRRIIAGKWGCNNGQACISPDYIITTKDYAPKLVDALKAELETFYGKNPLESKDLSRIVNSNHFARLTKLLDDDKVSGKIVYGGKKDESKLKISPTVLLDVPRDSLIMTEEIFGPLLPILTVDKLEESFDVINSGPKPLAAYIFTTNKKLKEQFVGTISAGGLVVNDTTLHLAVHTLPFGGVGESGVGSYHGKFSFDAFSHKKAVLYRSFIGDAPIRYPPYTNTKMRLLKALIGGGILGIIRALFGWS